jgi:diacylglycerol O-acyltransferase
VRPFPPPSATLTRGNRLASTYYERLSTQDASFVLFEGAVTHMHVSAVAIFAADPKSVPGGTLDIERLRAYVASRLHRSPRYRQKLAFTPLTRHPIWVDDERFNLHYHVRHTALPSPGSEDKLKDLAGRILSQQLDRRKPLWEMWFVEGLEGARFAAIIKAHHCMVDGAAGVGLLQELLGLSASPDFDSAPTWSPRPAPGRWELLADEALRGVAAPPAAALRALGAALRRPQRTSEAVAESAEAVWNALRAGLRVPAETPLNAPIGTHRRVEWRDLELAAVKDVKKRLDGTVNDVVLAVVTGALRRFLRRRRVPLGRHDFRVVIPVDMRRGPEDRSASNRVSALFLSLPLANRDPLRRFEQLKAESRRLKESRTAHGIDLMTRFADWTGSELVTEWGVRLVSALRPYNMIVTNVHGPPVPLYMLGSRLVAMYPQLPLFTNQGLGVAVMSYRDKVSFGMIADWDLVPDLPDFARALATSFAELQEEAERL